jgi:orotate phosphoribosyltransferase
MMPVTFLTYEKLNADVKKWSMALPTDLSMIVGVPRSGMLVATQLGLFRNLAVMTVPQFVGLLQSEAREPALRRGYAHGWRALKNRHVLVVDDTLLRGNTMSRQQQLINANVEDGHTLKVSYGALYTLPGNEGLVDFSCEAVPQRRLMEWNFMHSDVQMKKAALDCDGVLCEDWTGQEQDSDPEYELFITNARPLHLPTAPVGAIVTGRLEKYRDITEAWLSRHHVKYGELIMHPAALASVRRAGKPKTAAEIKAHVYASDKFNLFVESHPKHAKRIAELTGKPVIATDTMTLFQ